MNPTLPPINLAPGAEEGPAGLLRRAKQRLDASPCLPLHQLTCHLVNGALEVRGTVPTRYAKRLALACLTCLEGVQMVIDSIGVQFP